MVRKFQSGFFAFETKHFLPRSSLGKSSLFLLLEGKFDPSLLMKRLNSLACSYFAAGFSYPADVEVLIIYGY